MTQPRKTDRRTIFTVTEIKDAFLKLIDTVGYNQINVSKLCKTASITRSTFYLHFDNLDNVLNAVLDDALLFNAPATTELTIDTNISIDFLKENESLLPACQRIADSNKYHQLLMDSALSEYIIGRIIQHERPIVVPAIQKRTGLSEKDAELLFIYSIHGSFAINRRHHFIKNEAWYHELQLLNQFTSSGYQYLSRLSK